MTAKLLDSQQGAVLITALFVMALVSIASIAMLERFRIELRNTTLLLNDIQSHLYAEGSIAWAIEQLNNNWRNKKPGKVIDLLPQKSPINMEGNRMIYSIISDPSGLLNVNNLSHEEYHFIFIKLLQTVSPGTDIDTAKQLLSAIQDWIAPSASETLLFDEFYAKQTPVYRAPHRPMASISELRLVKGITREQYYALLPYVSALPELTKINVNTAPVPVLVSISPAMSLESAQAIATFRKKSPFPSLEHFLQLDIVKNNAVSKDRLSVDSNYFLVKTNVKVENQEIIRYTLIQRLLKNGEPKEIILWQSMDTL